MKNFQKFLFLILFIYFSNNIEIQEPSTTCKKSSQSKHACICDIKSGSCPKFERIGNLTNSAAVYKTSKGTNDRLTRYSIEITNTPPSTNPYIININTEKNFQTMQGFGGAITDAACITINQMSQEAQKVILDYYYGENGIQYSIGRIPMGSCDFSQGVYSYCDSQEDLQLKNFSVEIDKTSFTGFKIQTIQRIQNLTSRKLDLFASIWAPPAWMTNSNKTTGNPTIRDEPKIYESYSNYFVKFFQEYQLNNIKFWGMTVQNEPRGNTGAWQDLIQKPEEQRDFIKKYLGPKLRKEFPQLKIMMFDDQRYNLPEWTQKILGDQDTNPYVDGIGVHWYTSVEDTLVDFTQPFKKMQDTHDKHPDKFILATEACTGYLPWSQGPILGDWKRGEVYGYDILNDITHSAIGWTDWNIVLNMQGGPNWAKNVVDSPILADINDKNLFYLQPMFFYMGHFSKFVPQGSVRIDCQCEGLLAPWTVAFQTPDDNIVVIILNNSIISKQYTIKITENKYVSGKIDENSIQSVVFKL